MRCSVALFTALHANMAISATLAYSRLTISNHYTVSESQTQGAAIPMSKFASLQAHDMSRLPFTELSVSRRGYDIVGDDWSTNLVLLNVFNPTQPAARALEQFYEAVLEQILFHSGDTPEGRLCLSARGICMGFRCLGGRLPWELVRVAVRAMLEATQQGFAGEFRSEWHHLPSGIVIQVGLVVIDDTVRRIMSGVNQSPILPVACQLRA